MRILLFLVVVLACFVELPENQSAEQQTVFVLLKEALPVKSLLPANSPALYCSFQNSFGNGTDSRIASATAPTFGCPWYRTEQATT